MAVYTTTTGTAGLLPAAYGNLVVQPAMNLSISAQISTRVLTSAHSYHVPLVIADPTAAWGAEGAEISPSDPLLDELAITSAKVAGLTIIYREMADDSTPAAAEVVGGDWPATSREGSTKRPSRA